MVQEMHAFVACIRIMEPVRQKNSALLKVAHHNRCSNLPGDLALIHGRGVKRHKTERQRASMRPAL